MKIFGKVVGIKGETITLEVDDTSAIRRILTLLKFVLTNQVPLPKGIKILDENMTYYLYLCLINRTCAVCGKSGADIDHFNEAVGMGRNRKTIDHSQMTFCALCRTHHQEKHTMGADAFSQKYHVEGIRLNSEKRKKLGLGGWLHG